MPLYDPAGLAVKDPIVSVPPINTSVYRPLVIKGDRVLDSPMVSLIVPPLLPDKYTSGPFKMVIKVPGSASTTNNAGVGNADELIFGKMILPSAVLAPV